MRILLSLRAVALISVAWLLTSAVAIVVAPILAVVVLWFIACCAAMDFAREIWDIA